MYCDGVCDWWEPAMLAYYGALLLGVIIVVALSYGLYRLVRRLKPGRTKLPETEG